MTTTSYLFEWEKPHDPACEVQPGQQADHLPEEVAEPIEVVERFEERELYAIDPTFKTYLIVEEVENTDPFYEEFLPVNFPKHIWESDYLAIKEQVGSFETLNDYLVMLKDNDPNEYEQACFDMGDFIHRVVPENIQDNPLIQKFKIWNEARLLEQSVQQSLPHSKPRRTHKL